jgi:amino acid transporter/nucleotide-binding universal stress UspA family protein
MSSAEQQTQQQNGEVQLARDLGLFDASMIGLGAMIGAGIFVLTGLAFEAAGPGAIWTFALNGVVSTFTALSYAELASAIPEAGGGYSFVRRAMPRWAGFLAGWMLWFAYTVACALYARGFASYSLEVMHRYAPDLHHLLLTLGQRPAEAFLVLLIVGLFVGLNYAGAKVTGVAENVITVAKIIVLGVFIYFGLKVVADDPTTSLQAFVPMFPNGFWAVITAMGLTFIAFEGYDLIATVSEEIKDPERNIPKAIFISLGGAVLIYLLIIFVSLGAIRVPDMEGWRFLGQHGETAVVQAAASFMPFFGVVLIVTGGLLSTMSALNATVLASSRVAFSMGRDSMLPRVFGAIHAVRQTPHVAVLVTGVVLVVVAVSFPIEEVGSAASLMFLLSFAMTNAAAWILRVKEPDLKRRFKVPFYPIPQLLGVVTCIILAISQFWLFPMAWAIAVFWVAVGLAGFFLVLKRAPVEVRALAVPTLMPFPKGSGRVLVPVANPASFGPLFNLAKPLADVRKGQVTLLNVQVVPVQTPLSIGGLAAPFRIQAFRKLVADMQAEGKDVAGVVRVAHRISAGILAAASHPGVSLVLMGWRGSSREARRATSSVLGATMDNVMRRIPVNVAVVRIHGDFTEIKRILLPSAGGPHARYAAKLARDLQEVHGCEVVALGVVKPEASERVKGRALGFLEVTVAEARGLECSTKLVEHNDVVKGIIEEAANGYDLVMVGANRDEVLKNLGFGNIPEQIAQRAPCSVMMVRRG